MNSLLDFITGADDATRNQALETWAERTTFAEMLTECARLEEFRHQSPNLYERVRASLFLYALHRFHLPARAELPRHGHIPFAGYAHFLERRFEQAIDVWLHAQNVDGPSDALSSALAATYHRIAFQTLADQVRASVRSTRGNQWMFRVGHAHDQPLRVRRELLSANETGAFPILQEATPVRMDLTHSAWSDIFFLGMDFPEGARVLNVSIDLAVRPIQSTLNAPTATKPPVEAYFRVIDQPIIRLVSVDLEALAEVHSLEEIFDFGRDYLGLLKAALIASGLIPPGLEGSGQSLADVLEVLVGPNRGLELVSSVNGIPKGSRLAVSTNLLAALIAVCMRATGQAKNMEGGLEEIERRIVASRAILGEWLAGSGGGWQDSGGVWPGIKLIEGQIAHEGDAEWGISRGRLLPRHRVLNDGDLAPDVRQKLQESLVLVHGGMAQNVGPILEMVTEKYLLRAAAAWQARGETGRILDDILEHLRDGDIRAIGDSTTRNFFGPLQAIVPWATNLYTESLIQSVRQEFGEDFWGFWMLGGMSGGGMGFIFAPARKHEAQKYLQQLMSDLKGHLGQALPFAMEPVVYDFAINERGTWATFAQPQSAPLPPAYYTQIVPHLLRRDPRALTATQRTDLDAFAHACRTRPELGDMVQVLFERLLPHSSGKEHDQSTLIAQLEANGFDDMQHERIRADLKHGRIGLAQNRLPVNTSIADVQAGDVVDAGRISDDTREVGMRALQNGEAAVVTLAAGAGSRWTQGAGVVKALHPFAKLGGRHRSFLEVHLAKSRRWSRECGVDLPHIVTTSYLTHDAIAQFLKSENNYDYSGPLELSAGRSIGLRLVPNVRDLRYAWEEMPQQMLDEQAQKMRQSGQAALLDWAAQHECEDYTDNLPNQCLHPIGHWYEVPNLLRNGTLHKLLQQRPNLKYLMLHNIDTLGADVDPALLGLHIEKGGDLSYEVIARRLEDRGGGLARANGQLRLIEGLAMPREEIEWDLSFYNTLTTWISIDPLLKLFGLTRADLNDEVKVLSGVRAVAARMPTYITLKDVKKRWGHGQEDVFPVAQWEKLWGDMTALPELDCRFFAVARNRGQQLKEPAQLDGWWQDGSAAYIESLCAWE